MSKKEIVPNAQEISLDALILEVPQDKYKLSYSAIRWAKEIKQKESLPDPVPSLVPRALREILSGKVTYEEIEKLSPLAKVVVPAVPAAPAAPPTLSLNPEAAPEPAAPVEKEETPAKESKEDAAEEE